MKLKELLNPRVSYQVLVTFDLFGADPAVYRKLRDQLAEELDLETIVHSSSEEGGKSVDTPHNTLAVLWSKDSSETETRDYFEKEIAEIMRRNDVNGRYLVLVAQNWAVGADEF